MPDYGEFARRDWPKHDQGYARMVQLMDETVGQVLGKLAERGLTDNTLVAFGSDNGGSKGSGRNFDFFQSNGALRGIKRDLYEGGIRVPLIVRWPGRIKAGSVSHHVNAMRDLYPTFCDAAGATPPAGLDGLSFLPTLLGRGMQKQHAYLYWEFYEQGGSQAVREGRWKAVRRNIKTGTETFELFDLDADPGESRDLAPTQPAVVARLRARMAEAHTPHPVLSFARSQPVPR